MAGNGTDSIIQYMRRALQLHEGGGLSDGQLLDDFIVNQDAGAFEILVRRHGRMVHGVCLRVLRNSHDAEDAFQATFLVLAHKAASVIPREMVGNWLYGVAHTTALRARAAAAKRRARERQAIDMSQRKSHESGQWDDLQPLLDQELARLPDKYRLAVVLCDLEGRSRREVAGRLKIPEGTLSSRLTTARRLLAKRLSRHGLAVSGGALAALLSQNAASAWLPPTLVMSTVKAATVVVTGQAAASAMISIPVVALKEGVLKVMLLNKLKSMAVLTFMVAVLGVGGGLIAQRTAAAQQAESGNKRLHPPALKGERPEANPAETEAGQSNPMEPISRGDAAKPTNTETGRDTADDSTLFAKMLETESRLSLREAIAIALKNGRSGPKDVADDPPDMTASQQRAEMERGVHNLLLNVEVAYWNLVAARSMLDANEEALGILQELSMNTAKSAKQKSESTPPELLAQLEGQFRMECTNSLGKVVETGRDLRRIMGLRVDETKLLVPVTAPTLRPYEPKWEVVLKDALSRRPELTLARENVRIKESALAREKNSLKPESASERTARLQLAQALSVLKDQEDRVTRTASQQYQALNKWYRLIEDRRAERRAYTEALSKKCKLVELGKKSVDLDLLDTQRRLALAQTKEYQAIGEYNNTLARLAFARTIMQRDQVVITQTGSRLIARVFGPDGDGASKASRSYTAKVTLVQADPNGKNYGKLGKGEILGERTTVLREDKTGLIRFTKEAADEEDGVRVQLKITGQGNGRIRLESFGEMCKSDHPSEDLRQVSGEFIRAIASAKLGENIHFVLKNHQGQPRYYVNFEITETAAKAAPIQKNAE